MVSTRERLEQALQDRGITGEAEIDAIISLLTQEPPPTRMDYVSLPILATLLHETSNRLEATIDAKFTELRAEFTKELSTLRSESEDRFNKIEARLDKIENWSGTVNARFDKVDDRFDRVDDRFDKVDDRFERFEDRIDNLAERIDQLVQAIAEMGERHERDMRNLAEQAADHRTTMLWRVVVLVSAVIAAGAAIAGAVIAAVT